MTHANRSPGTARPPSGQSGRSIVELMIAIAIGLAITAGMAAAYVGASRTAKVSGELAGIADSGQVAMMLIGDSIKQSGYGEVVGSDPVLGAAQVDVYRSQTLFGPGVSIAGCTSTTFADDTAAAPTCAGGAGDPNFDALMVRFQGDAVIPPSQGVLADCLGVAPPPSPLPVDHIGTVRAANRPVLQNAYFGSAGALWCRGNGRVAEADAFPAAQQLVANVEQFKVFFGFDDVRYANPGSAAGPSVRSLRTATYLNGLPAASLPWDFVISVHVCMVVRSGTSDTRALSANDTSSYVRCPLTEAEAAGAPNVVTSTDRALRRTYAQVFSMRARSTANPRQFMP